MTPTTSTTTEATAGNRPIPGGRAGGAPHLVEGASGDGKGPRPTEEFGVAKLVGDHQGEGRGVRLQLLPDRAAADRSAVGYVLFSLVFYVIYTIWYGYAVMFLFEGLGFRLAH